MFDRHIPNSAEPEGIINRYGQDGSFSVFCHQLSGLPFKLNYNQYIAGGIWEQGR